MLRSTRIIRPSLAIFTKAVLPIATIRFPLGAASTLTSTSTSIIRSYATEDKNTDPRLLELMHKVQTTQEVTQALHEFHAIISKKGIIADGSFSTYYKIMKDEDVKNALNKVVIEMNNAGIQISADLLKPILDKISKDKKE